MSPATATKTWRYQGLGPDGVVEGQTQAASEVDLDKFLQKDGITLLSAKAVRSGSGHEAIKMSGSDLVTFTTQLSTVLGAGVPIVDGMRSLGTRMRKPASQRVVEQVVKELEGGSSLSDALSSRPRSFPPIYRASVAAGELSGSMPQVLQRLASHMEWTREIRQTTTQAMVYPCILGLAIVGLVVTLVTFLVPRIVKMFPGGRDELPAQTQQVMAISEFVTGNWIPIVVGIVGSIVGALMYRKTPSGKLFFGTAALHIPRVGEVVRMFATAKFASTAGTLQNAGCPINDVIDLGGTSCGNARMAKAFHDANERVKHGESILNSLSKQPYIDPLLLQMVGVGEQAGDLAGCLDKLGEHYDRELPRMVKWMLSLLEPFILVVGGLVVTYMLFAAFLPLLDMYDKL